MNKKISRSKWLATSALLSAMASVLMFWELPVPLMPPFIKLDFSLLPCIIGSIALGPTSGIVVTTIKELIHLMIRSKFHRRRRKPSGLLHLSLRRNTIGIDL